MAEPIPGLEVPPRRGDWRVALAALVPVALSIVWIYVRHVDVGRALPGAGEFTIAKPWVKAALGWAALGATVAWLILAVIVRGLRASLGLILAAGMFTWMCAFGGRAVWTGTILGVAASDDGTTWGAVRWSGFMSSGWSVVIVSEESPVATRVEVVAKSHFGFDGISPLVVRPASARRDAAILLTRTGLVVAVSGEHCTSAFDPATGTEWTNLQRDDDRSREGSAAAPRRSSRPLDSLSPFALLGDDEEGSEDDLRAIVDAVEEAARLESFSRSPADPLEPFFRGTLPSRGIVEAELASPNSWVRAAAKRILEAAGPAPGSGK